MSPSAPRVWVLLGEHGGDNAQLTGLAASLGWPFATKRLRFNLLSGAPSVLLGAARIGLAHHRSDPLVAPWPDLVLFAGFRAVSIARWIRRRAGERTRLVAIGRPRAPLGLLDLVVTTAQYGLPARPNVLHNTLTLNRPDPQRLAEAAEAWRKRLADLPRPWTALLVGGDTRRRQVDVAWAERLANAVNAHRDGIGGSVLATTSPRTPAAVSDALDRRLSAPRHFFRWRADGDNPYTAYLALADTFIVTGDSASMLSEACWSGKPVFVFAPSTDERRAPASRLLQPLVRAGLLTPDRDMAAFRAGLIAAGMVSPLGESTAARPSTPPPDFDAAIARIRALFAGSRAT